MFGRYPIKTVRRIIFTIALALLALMTSVVFSTQRFEPINELYVYGDSLSDMGTVFRATGECIHHNRATFGALLKWSGLG